MAGERRLLVELPITVKTYDVDFAGIVHNLVYVRWLEDLRLQLLAETMPVEEMLVQGIGPILSKTEIEYRQPARLGDTLLGRLWVDELGRTRWTVQAEIVDGDRMVATATQTGFFADMETARPVRVPEKLRRAWERAA